MSDFLLIIATLSGLFSGFAYVRSKCIAHRLERQHPGFDAEMTRRARGY